MATRRSPAAATTMVSGANTHGGQANAQALSSVGVRVMGRGANNAATHANNTAVGAMLYANTNLPGVPRAVVNPHVTLSPARARGSPSKLAASPSRMMARQMPKDVVAQAKAELAAAGSQARASGAIPSPTRPLAIGTARPKGLGLRLLRNLNQDERSPMGSPQSMPAQSPQGSLSGSPQKGRQGQSPVARRRLALGAQGATFGGGATSPASPQATTARSPAHLGRLTQSRFAHERIVSHAAAAENANAARSAAARDAAAQRSAALRKVMSAPDGQLQGPTHGASTRRGLGLRKPLPLPPAMLGSPVAGSVVASPQKVRGHNVSFNNRYGAPGDPSARDTPSPNLARTTTEHAMAESDRQLTSLLTSTSELTTMALARAQPQQSTPHPPQQPRGIRPSPLSQPRLAMPTSESSKALRDEESLHPFAEVDDSAPSSSYAADLPDKQLVLFSKLKSCIVRSDVDAFEAPLAKDVDVNAVHSPGEETLLHEAARVGNTEICTLLVTKYNMDPNSRDRLLYTPLHHACQYSHRGAVRALLNAGASIRARTVSGETPLQLATSDRVRRLFGHKIGGTSPDTPAQPTRPEFDHQDPFSGLVSPPEIGYNVPVYDGATSGAVAISRHAREGNNSEDDGDSDSDSDSVNIGLDIPERTQTPPLLRSPPKHKFHASPASHATKSLETTTPRVGVATTVGDSADSEPPPVPEQVVSPSPTPATPPLQQPRVQQLQAQPMVDIGLPPSAAYPNAGLHPREGIFAIGGGDQNAAMDAIDTSLYPAPSASGDLVAELAARMTARAAGDPVDAVGPKGAMTAIEAQTNMFQRSVHMQTGGMHWARGELIGEGAYGKVYAGLCQKTGELMAVKQMNLVCAGEVTDAVANAVRRKASSLEREIEMYKALCHKHVVRYIACETVDEICYVFLEFVPGGSIASMLRRFGAFSETLTARYARQILLGLEYMHNSGVAHRDVKGANILVARDGVIKLADFGASRLTKKRSTPRQGDDERGEEDAAEGAAAAVETKDEMSTPTAASGDEDERSNTNGMKSIHGSIFWMAPETVRGQGYGRRADIWSAGATVVEMLTAKRPWPDLENHWSAMFAIARATGGPPLPKNLTAPCAKFLSRCFMYDPKDRPVASELLGDAFLVSSESAVREATQAVELKHSL